MWPKLNSAKTKDGEILSVRLEIMVGHLFANCLYPTEKFTLYLQDKM